MKAVQKIFFGIFSFVGVPVLIWLGAHLFTDTSQWARAIAWLDSDIDDYKRFPMRLVTNDAPCPGYLSHPPGFLNVKRAEVVTIMGNYAVLSLSFANLGTA